jgi:hypothetical protein
LDANFAHGHLEGYVGSKQARYVRLRSWVEFARDHLGGKFTG